MLFTPWSTYVPVLFLNQPNHEELGSRLFLSCLVVQKNVNFFQVGEKGSLNSAFKAQSVSVTNMLEKLVMEKELKFVAFAEEVQCKAMPK